MTDQLRPFAADNLPQAQPHRRLSGAWIWLLPIVTALLGISWVVHAWLHIGPTITIDFKGAEGVTPGKTPVKYKSVTIGKVDTVRLGPHHKKVIVTVTLDKSAENFATVGTSFWIVRPRIELGGISGVSTLFSGIYIGADTSDSTRSKHLFIGLSQPPAIRHGALGHSFLLHAKDLGSLDVGSPVYYRHIQVGKVESYHLNQDGSGVTLRVFVDSPNDRFVTGQSRFWNASGVDVSLDANGLKLDTQSLSTILAGGVAFGSYPHAQHGVSAKDGAHFQLFATKTLAMEPPDKHPYHIRMRFDHAARGLVVGVPVDFFGISLGKVVSIGLNYDKNKHAFMLVVDAVIYPRRLGDARSTLLVMAKAQGEQTDFSHLLENLVAHGLRSQIRIGNLLTGQLYIALDFMRHVPKVRYNPTTQPLEIPSVPGSFDGLQDQLAHIVDNVNKIPFARIGTHLDDALVSLNTTLKQMDVGVLSSDSPLQQNLDVTLKDVQRMARSLRILTDDLSVYPEQLIRGRRADPKLTTLPHATARFRAGQHEVRAGARP